MVFGFKIDKIINKFSSKLPEDPVFGTWYYLSFKKKILVDVLDTKCSPKIMYLDLYKYRFGPKTVTNTSISWGITFLPLVPVPSPQEAEEKDSKKVLFGYLYRSKYLIFFWLHLVTVTAKKI
jgi:hypothetical protein